MPRLRPIDPDDDHLTWEEFESSVECGCFIDYDGFAELATADGVSHELIKPSDLHGFVKPSWVTHVVWYNK